MEMALLRIFCLDLLRRVSLVVYSKCLMPFPD